MAKVGLDTPAGAALLPAPRHVDVVDFSRDAIEAALSSNVALSAGLEAIGQEVAHDARTAFASAGETARSLLNARTLEDVGRLQTDFAKRSLERFVERSAKLTELGCSLVGASVGAWGARAKR